MHQENLNYYLACCQAGEDLSSHSDKFVKLTSAGVMLCGDSEYASGVLKSASNVGENCLIYISPAVINVKVGEDLLLGDLIKSDASGLAAKANASGDVILGTALESVTLASGDMVSIQLMSYGKLA